MVALGLEVFEQAVERFALGHKHGGAQDVFQLELLGVERVFEQVFGVQDADDVVFVFFYHGKARMGGVHGIGDNAVYAVCGFDNIHLRAGHHGIAHG